MMLYECVRDSGYIFLERKGKLTEVREKNFLSEISIHGKVIISHAVRVIGNDLV
jgi:hypothetical protein